MKLIVLGSSSEGNGYILKSATETLILEAGVKAREVRKALGYDLGGLVGCIITHRHGDHAKYVRDYLNTLGCKVLALGDVFLSRLPRSHPNAEEIMPMKGYRLGRFMILPFPVAHDAPCVGYIIQHPEMGRLAFVTDTMMLEQRLPRINHFMLETNYSDRLLRASVDAGTTPQAMQGRITKAHMELETAKEILRVNDLSCLREVILIHLSENHSDPDLFMEQVSRITGLPTYVASKGFEVELENDW